MSAVILAIAVVGGVGLFVGIFLGIAAIRFKVEVDEKEEAVLAALPGNNCGGCGFPGCGIGLLGYTKERTQSKELTQYHVTD